MKAFLISTLAMGLSLSATVAMAQTQDTTTPPSPPPSGGKMGKMMMGPMTKEQHRQHAEQMFKEWDTDGNGTITRQEFMAAHDAKFDKMDTNKDGTVSMEEHRSAMREKKQSKAQQ